jgi:hypothetical protein
VARNTIIVGILLILLAMGFYLPTLAKTALSPLGPGVPILICGLIALRGESARKHAMHVAMVFALLGGLASLYPIIALLTGGGRVNAGVESLIMLVICAVYLGLGIKSFKDARKAREAAEA